MATKDSIIRDALFAFVKALTVATVDAYDDEYHGIVLGKPDEFKNEYTLCWWMDRPEIVSDTDLTLHAEIIDTFLATYPTYDH